jgi:hypothetical protein
MYAVIGTRADLAFTVTLLSQFSSNPSKEYLAAAKHTLRYLKLTKDWMLKYLKPTTDITCYTDSSYASDQDDRKSFSGYVLYCGKSAISWYSKKQNSVALSTTEAEYMAMSPAAKQLIWIKNGLKELGITSEMGMLGDDQGALELAKNPRIHSRSKHIDVHYHFTREKLANKEFTLA